MSLSLKPEPSISPFLPPTPPSLAQRGPRRPLYFLPYLALAACHLPRLAAPSSSPAHYPPFSSHLAPTRSSATTLFAASPAANRSAPYRAFSRLLTSFNLIPPPSLASSRLRAPAGEQRRVSAATELLAVAAGACGLVLMDEPCAPTISHTLHSPVAPDSSLDLARSRRSLSGLDSVNATLLTHALVELTSVDAVGRLGVQPGVQPGVQSGVRGASPHLTSAHRISPIAATPC